MSRTDLYPNGQCPGCGWGLFLYKGVGYCHNPECPAYSRSTDKNPDNPDADILGKDNTYEMVASSRCAAGIVTDNDNEVHKVVVVELAADEAGTEVQTLYFFADHARILAEDMMVAADGADEMLAETSGTNAEVKINRGGVGL